MASVMTCRVHPVVALTIVDAYERRSNKEGSKDKVMGTLLGFYDKNAIEVTNCYAAPFSEAKGEPEFDATFNVNMFEMTRNAVPSENAVGWFSTDSELSPHVLSYHDYYQTFLKSCHQVRSNPPVVLVTLDTQSVADTNRLKSDPSYKPFMGIRAYLRTKAGIPGEGEAHCAIFMPLKVEIVTFEAEQIGLDLILSGTMNAKRQAHMVTGVEQLTKTTNQMLTWIDKIRTYIDEVLAGKRAGDSTVGRKLMELVNNVRQLQPVQFENMVKSSMRDYLMVSYLAQLANTQLALHEKLLSV